MVGNVLKDQVSKLLASWQNLQAEFRATRDALSGLSTNDGSILQKQLRASQEGWRQVVDATKRAQSQLTNIPARVDHVRPHALPQRRQLALPPHLSQIYRQ
eukprot:Phypoly_transcript_05467.p1 GENE.Phypoly_transcript_05467~~Phypoly_transcript_05467.p1  ORF type:complete len:101 (+),score=21.69 Phypoly_transcript_05467:979-1281(+)